MRVVLSGKQFPAVINMHDEAGVAAYRGDEKKCSFRPRSMQREMGQRHRPGKELCAHTVFPHIESCKLRRGSRNLGNIRPLDSGRFQPLLRSPQVLVQAFQREARPETVRDLTDNRPMRHRRTKPQWVRPWRTG